MSKQEQSNSGSNIDLISTSIETTLDLLNKKWISLGIPSALVVIGIKNIFLGQKYWREALFFFLMAAAFWLIIKIGKALSPKLEKFIDWAINGAEQSVIELASAIYKDFEGKYLQQQAGLWEEAITDGYTPDRTAIPLLEDVFVPLELSGKQNTYEESESLDIWTLLKRSRADRKFRKMVILAKGGMGKTTLLKHIALIYGQRKYKKYHAPKLVPILLRLRKWSKELTAEKTLTLPQFITEFYIPSLSDNHPLKTTSKWAENLLEKGLALVMFDGFDEIPLEKRAQVSQWLSDQMQRYSQSVFILTSRPGGYKDYTARKPTVPLFINKFNFEQQQDFIRRWYLCQEECYRSRKQRHHAKKIARKRAAHLINQLIAQRKELAHMAENPLLLNMLVTFHRFEPTKELPRQRLGLYRGICKLQLDDRPRARGIQMELSFENSQSLLQNLALKMVSTNRLTLPEEILRSFLLKQPLVQQDGTEPMNWVHQMLNISELLVEREPGEYEFPHISFQGFFASTRLAQSQDVEAIKNGIQLVLKNWTEATWRETILLYIAQLSPRVIDPVIRAACRQSDQAAALAIDCLKEYPRPEKLNNRLLNQFQILEKVAQRSKYQRLENLLHANKWYEADQETYRLMITTVGKENGQSLSSEDFRDFPPDEFRLLDQLWTHHSKNMWGFSVQKKIWQDCHSPMDCNSNWEEFGNRVAWRKGGAWLNYNTQRFDRHYNLSVGELPRLLYGLSGVRLAYRKVSTMSGKIA